MLDINLIRDKLASIMTQSREPITQTAEPVNITIKLVGEDAAKFVAYKAKENLKLNSAAATKLILDRLAQLEGVA